MNSTTAAAPAATPCPAYGLGLSEIDDSAWLTDATGKVIFTGTTTELLASIDLMAGLSQRQRAALPSFIA